MTHFGVIAHLSLVILIRWQPWDESCNGVVITFVQIPDFEPLVRSQKLNFWPIGRSTYRPGRLAKVFAQQD